MANKFQFDITARDKTAEGLRSAEKGFERLVKGTPFERINKGLGAIKEKASAFQGISRSLLSMGDAGSIAGGGIGEAAGGLEGLAAGAGLAGLAVGGVTAGLAAGVAAAYKFEDGITKSGAKTGYLAQVLGLSAQQLQAFEIAGQKVGVSSDAMAGALQNVGNVLNDARFGRNQTALALLTRLNIQIKYNKDGSIDAASAMNDLADAMVNGNAQTKQMIVAQFGVGAAENFMLQSTQARRRAIDEAMRSSANMTDQQIADSQRFQKSVSDLDEAWHGWMNLLSQNVIMPWLQPALDGVTKLISGVETLTQDGKLLQKALGIVFWPEKLLANAHGVGNAPPAAAAGPSKSFSAATTANARAADVIDYFVKQGWTRQQAAGIAANFQAESGFNAHAIGDRGSAYGIGQWHADRQAAFAAWAGHSIRMAGLPEQLAFAQYELTQGSRKAAGDRLKSATSAAEAGAIVSRYYESPADVAGEMGRRGALAALMAGEKPAAAGAAAPPDTTQAANGGAGASVQVAQGAPAVNGTVTVDITLKGAPPGAIASVSPRGAGVSAGVKIVPAMQGAA